MRSIVFGLFLGLAMFLTVDASQMTTAQDNTLLATTTDYTNFRVLPSLGANVITILDPGTPVQLIGRTSDAQWLEAIVDETEGWLFFTLVATSSDIQSLPITATSQTSSESVDSSGAAIAIGNGNISASTTGPANFRSGPGTGYDVIAGLTVDTPLTLTGQNMAGTWLQASAAGQIGWIYAPLVTVDAETASLPVVAAPSSSATSDVSAGNDSSAVSSTNTSANGGVSASIVSNIGSRSAQIFAQGQQLGNRADVFSKVGDSISRNPVFLYGVGVGGLQLGPYTYLQPTVDFFSQTGARTHNSFANESLAVRSGWASGDVLNAANAPTLCAGESPLVCEYRQTRPAVALIMFGTNDILRGVPLTTFQANMQTIISTSITMGVIPVISTIPDIDGPTGGQVQSFNNVIRALAASNGTPLWDYWSALQTLPSRGLSSDGYHPSFDPTTGQTAIFDGYYMTYGYNVRNLTALVVLDTLRQRVLS